MNNINFDTLITQGVIIKKYLPDFIEINVKNIKDKQCMVILNNYSKYWQLKINGEHKKLNQFSNLFWLINLNKSDKQNIKLSYEPPYKKYLGLFYNLNKDF